MNLLNKVRSFMLGTDIDDDGDVYIDEYVEEYVDEEPPAREREWQREPERERYTPTRAKRTSLPFEPKVLNLPTSSHGADSKTQVIICRPEVVEDATTICDHLKHNVMCVVNLEGVERGNAQRIADFLGGSCYALNGEIQRISNEIFLIAPANIGISSELREELKSSGLVLPWIASAFK